MFFVVFFLYKLNSDFYTQNRVCLKAKKIVITGGPGTGKSSIINELINRGYTCLEEISRQVILDSKKNGIDQLFLANPLLFSKLLLKGRQQQYDQANKLEVGTVFLDRGIPDVLAYMDFIDRTYPQNFIDACKNSIYDFVFILKPWQEIYIIDNERYESFEEALKIHEYLLKTYQFYNYQLLDVPFNIVEKRVDYILNVLNI